ncbi:non-ribosomal peptide synthetase [Streptomyces sp. NPDC005562]|uniref:non-ribosomal peptide synthetase n=1 Tax=Streptomyces sp. NPDC005562 TaxID=3154890 RepID=UPI0033BF176E
METTGARTVLDLVRQRAVSQPDRPAIECGPRILTYGELWEESHQLAGRIQDTREFRTDRPVGTHFERGITGLVAQLATWRAGGFFVPLDPALPDQRIRKLLEQSGTEVVLTQPGPERAAFDGVRIVDASDAQTHAPLRPESGDTAYVLFTSGSQGEPKGVAVPHTGLGHLLTWHGRTYGTAPGVRVAAFAGLGFDAYVWETWAALGHGATLCLPDGPPLYGDIAAVHRFLEEHRIEQCFLSTPLAEQLLAMERAPVPLRKLFTGGDRLRVRPPADYPAAVHNHYGPTEATVVTTASEDLRTQKGPRLPSIGRPLPGVTVQLVDQQGAVITGAGQEGELLIGGVQLADGYWLDADLTRERFRVHADGLRRYATGDICRWNDEGDLEFVGRSDEQVSIRGHRVEPAETEQTLLSVPGVTHAVCLPVEDVTGTTLYAFCTGTATEDEVRTAARDQLPGHLVPTKIHRIAALPLTPHGKTDRGALLELAAAGRAAPAPEGVPLGAAEQEIAGVWAELTGTSPGPDDDFFGIGGHSILAARMVGEIRSRFRIDIGLAEVFAHPRLSDFTRRVTAARER